MGYIMFTDKKFENNKRVEPRRILAKNKILQSPPKSILVSSGQMIPIKPSIPALNTLIEVKNAAIIIKRML